ncbi:MAG TPA: hypothetical protein VGN12_19425 [Pirellulales bacterium]|jgi:hypothetical protein
MKEFEFGLRRIEKPAKRLQTEFEKRIALLLMANLAQSGSRMLEMLLELQPEQWRSFIYEEAISKLTEELRPIVARELKKYRLNQEYHVDDAVQRLLEKLRGGRYFKTYRATETLPSMYIRSCARKLAMTIARSIGREARRYKTNRECVEG